MRLQTYSRRGVGSIVVNDYASNDEIRDAMIIDSMEESGNGKPMERSEVRRVLRKVRVQGKDSKR